MVDDAAGFIHRVQESYAAMKPWFWSEDDDDTLIRIRAQGADAPIPSEHLLQTLLGLGPALAECSSVRLCTAEEACSYVENLPNARLHNFQGVAACPMPNRLSVGL